MFRLFMCIFQGDYLADPEETPNTTDKKEEEAAPLIAEAKWE